ncbi:MAG: glycerophosphoryl diester phosphodiesterase protein [Acidobacteriaceae bacterium]|nr:glycerophosphoryl diester phosphodiesterase protein [Acidobacteriaceae bacterium]
MNYAALRILVMALAIAFAPLLHAQQPLPVLQGVTTSVGNINTAKLLALMNHGSPDMVLLAAHRGYWLNYPENSIIALDQAFQAGIEIIEIDLRTTSDGQLVISHDTDLVKETTGSGLISSMTLSQLQALTLRDRHGNPVSNSLNLHLLSFAETLNLLKGYSGGGHGPVIIADIKDQTPWPAYLAGVQQVAATLDTATQPAVIFKMKMSKIPSIGAVQAEAAAHPSYGHMVLTVNPEDFIGPWAPSTSNFRILTNLWETSPNFVQQFEMNTNAIGDGTAPYTAALGSFATYYEPSFYPEGVSTITIPKDPNGVPTGEPPFTNCCNLHNLTLGSPNQDLRGVLPFALYYNSSSLITSDNIAETLNFLSSQGKRNVSELQ